MYKKIYGSMMGTALGDSIGLPFEGLSRAKIAKKNPSFKGQSLFFGKGMFSDDTEQTVAVAQSLIASYDDEVLFRKGMRWRLQKWFLALPAGLGFATLRAIIKSFFVKSPAVFSAGNAPAMRSALLGLCFGEEDTKLQQMVKINTELTHSDPKAYYGALAVAKATYLSSLDQEERFFEEMKVLVEDKEFRKLLSKVEHNLALSTLDFAKILGLEKGVGGYIYQTLPIVLHAWLKNPHDFKTAIISVIRCGGDTDTTGAILGSIIGAKGKNLPLEWTKGMIDYPINRKLIQSLSKELSEVQATQKVGKPSSFLWISSLFRNMVFLLIVLIVSVTRQF